MATTDARPEPPLIVIVGPTASGKTSLAIEVAQEWNGEIICADSRTVYKGMDIGTAKPSKKEQAGIPHWGLDLVEPGQRFTAYDFKMYTNKVLQDIRARKKTPILVGGTGLYVDAVLFDFQFDTVSPLDSSNKAREKHNNKQTEILPQTTNNTQDDKKMSTPTGIKDIFGNIIIVGITTEKTILRSQIIARIEQLFENGVVAEATLLGKKYGWDNAAMTANIYPVLHRYSRGELSLAEAKQACVTLDWRLAKRQLTWLRRNPHILWCSVDEAEQYMRGVLAEQ